MGNRIYLYAERQGSSEMLSEAKYELPPVWRLLLAGPTVSKQDVLTLNASKKGLVALDRLLDMLARQPDFQGNEAYLRLFEAITAYLSLPMTHLSAGLVEMYSMDDDQPETVFLSDVKASIVAFQQAALPLIDAQDRAGLNHLFGVESAEDWLSETGLTWWEDEYFWQSLWQTESWSAYQATKASAPVVVAEGIEAFCRSGQWGLRQLPPSAAQAMQVLAAPFADEILPFEEGAPVTGYRQRARWGLLNLEGHRLGPVQYDAIEGVYGGVVIVRVAGKRGLVKFDGQWLALPVYDDAYGFDEGLAPVCQDGKWGMLGLTGEVVIPLLLDDIHSASRLRESHQDGVRFLAKQGGWGLMNEEGQWIQPPHYDAIEWQQGAMAGWKVEQQGRLGRWSPLGTEWLACQWDSISVFPLGDTGYRFAWLVEQAGRKGVSGSSGEVWLPCEFDKIQVLEAIEAPARPDYYRFWQVSQQGKSMVWDLETRQPVLGMKGMKTVVPLLGSTATYLLAVEKQTQHMRFYTETGTLMFPYQFEWVHQPGGHIGAEPHGKGILDIHCLRQWMAGNPVEAMIGKGLKTSAKLTGSVWLFPDGKLIPDQVWQLPLAEAGQAEACYRMGGHCRETDPERAFSWFGRAAAQQHEGAIAEYAYLLYQRAADPADMIEVRALYEQVQHRFPWIQNNLACLLQHGEGGPPDPKRAFELYRRAAEQGVVVAMRNLAEAYCDGRGTTAHLPTAIRWFESAAAAGDTQAAARVASLLIQQDVATAGTRLQQQTRRERALRWARMAAEDQSLSSLLVLVDVLLYSEDPAAEEEARACLLSRQAIQPDPLISERLAERGW